MEPQHCQKIVSQLVFSAASTAEVEAGSYIRGVANEITGYKPGPATVSSVSFQSRPLSSRVPM
jgi:hypothetical protein